MSTFRGRSKLSKVGLSFFQSNINRGYNRGHVQLISTKRFENINIYLNLRNCYKKQERRFIYLIINAKIPLIFTSLGKSKINEELVDLTI